MRLFVYEHVTGGGLAGQEVSPGLVREADLMLRSLLRDLSEIEGVSCFTTRDARLPEVEGVECLPAEPGEPPLAHYRRGLARADAVWPTALETGGVLESLSRMALDAGRRLFGTDPDTVRLTASKRDTAIHLARAGVNVVPTLVHGEAVATYKVRAWVVKPDDGAGAEDALVYSDLEKALARLEQHRETHVLQPWIAGVPASLSLLCNRGEVRVLSCNRQRVDQSDGRLTLSAIEVNGLASEAQALAPLAAAVARALPGLWGYVGVDLVITRSGPVVLEVNPRLTTSWCGLRAVWRRNPAEWVVRLAQDGLLPELPGAAGQAMTVVNLEAAGVG